MAFTVQWTTSKGCVSVVRLTALSAYQEAERVTKLARLIHEDGGSGVASVA